MEQYWEAKAKNTEINLSQGLFVHYRSPLDWLGRESGLLRWEAGN
jgi:hypothetical protein